MNMWEKPVALRWSDLDPNFHLRHSVYYDFAATRRVEFLYEYGITAEYMREQKLGPILLREECVFRREIASGDEITIDMKVNRCRRDYSRWTVSHRILKKGNILSAEITVEGTWINTDLRKLALPTQKLIDAFEQVPRHENFVWDEKQSKPMS